MSSSAFDDKGGGGGVGGSEEDLAEVFELLLEEGAALGVEMDAEVIDAHEGGDAELVFEGLPLGEPQGGDAGSPLPFAGKGLCLLMVDEDLEIVAVGTDKGIAEQ